jgi:uncharacterized protein YbbC (DUF1343 family)
VGVTIFKNTLFLLLLVLISCGNKAQDRPQQETIESSSEPVAGAERMDRYLAQLRGKRIALVGNQTSVVRQVSGGLIHLVDTLLSRDIELVKVFAPEHGFRGELDAGEAVKDGVDTRTGLPVVSLYGKNKKPSSEQLQGLDLVVFDIQDVGARFYTYISTLHYVMEACAENSIPILVLDRPNPNGHYVDGPILQMEHSSFVGMHPVPVVYGMTMGEYASMINGSGWLKEKQKADLNVIPLLDYDRHKPYTLPVKPSPNLPNAQAVNLYPSLCLFEGTPISAGRGTQTQFQVFGAPFLPAKTYDHVFTPVSNPGAKYPKFENKSCRGLDLRQHPRLSQLELNWLIEAYRNTEDKESFFLPFFAKLAGTQELRSQIEQGMDAEDIRSSWKPGLEAFLEFRKPYLLYPE